MKYFLGIDGGGTKTTAAVSDENGNILLKKVGKTINFYSVGMEKARENLLSVIDEIYKELGQVTFESVFVGCSALDREADEQTLENLCGGINAKNIRMDSDLFVALKSVENAVCPCVAICGTGSMAIGEAENGEIKFKGGWGHILGDEGSGYVISLNALKCCANFSDTGEESILLEKAKEYFNVSDFRQAIDIIYSPETTKDVIAGFVLKVREAALEGDFIAESIIVNEAHNFARTVLCLLNEIEKSSVLALYGGIFQHDRLFRDSFIEDINEIYPELTIQLLDVPPEEGALKIARGLI
ncbi:MAG: hypothetical protein IJ279_03275 [Clostridia bacterium]|nr:hypothetical protein [Clostridia bacterium]